MIGYKEQAQLAAKLGFSPATVEDAVREFEALGVSRAAAYHWQRKPERCPMAARMAAAYVIHQRQVDTGAWMAENGAALAGAVQALTDPDKIRQIAEIVGLK